MDMADRLRANKPQAINGSYNQALADGTRTVSILADADINDWLGNLGTLLPSGDGIISCTAAGVCTVTVQWDIQREGGTALDQTLTTQSFVFQTSV